MTQTHGKQIFIYIPAIAFFDNKMLHVCPQLS
jgi:hypothetical protein